MSNTSSLIRWLVGGIVQYTHYSINLDNLVIIVLFNIDDIPRETPIIKEQ